MAWALEFDGINQLATFANERYDGNFEVVFDIYTTTSSFSGVIGGEKGVVGNAWVGAPFNANKWEFELAPPTTPRPFVQKTLPLNYQAVVRVGVENLERFIDVDGDIDSASVGSSASATFNRFGSSEAGGFYGAFALIRARAYQSGVLVNDWDATASDHSNTGLQPVLVDTIGGSDATGVNFPTDGSAWVDLGGGGLTITPTGIASAEVFGTAEIFLSTTTINPTPISSSEAFGTASLLPGGVVLLPSSTLSGEALGSPELIQAQIVEMLGVESAEAFGTPNLVYTQVIQPGGIGSEEVFGLAMISDGQAVMIPPTDRDTYQKIAAYLKSTGRFVSTQNNDIICEWLKYEGADKEQFNDLFKEYWRLQGYEGAYNDRWKAWRNDV